MAKAWFEPKTYGYGAGLPITWQGWALIAAYVGLLIGAGLLFLPRRPFLYAGVVVAATIVLVIVAEQRTAGGFRWRWGGDS